MVHGGGRKQRRDRHAVRTDLAVRQHDDVVAAFHRRFRAFAETVEHIGHAFGTARNVIGEIERLGVEAIFRVTDRADLFEIAIGQDRLAYFQTLAARGANQIEDVRARTDERDKAHHQLFADRINRWVRDLCEVLLEIGVKQLRLVGHGRNRRIRAHRTDGFLTGGGHWRHQKLGVFLTVTE
ncbi:hypothetical protein D9M70_520670 [compost metagenome]